MTEVNANLSANRTTQGLLRHRSAVVTLARMRAKKSILLRLRAQGFKRKHFSVREIAVLTDYHLNQHRARLIAEAEEVIETWQGFANFRANVKTNAHTEKPPISATSNLQISGAK